MHLVQLTEHQPNLDENGINSIIQVGFLYADLH